MANQSGIPRTTLVRYLELLSSVFLIKSIPAWSSGPTHRTVGTPKLAFVDTGIAAHLIGQDAARLGEPGGAAGPILENFVSMEIARQLTWSDSELGSTTTAPRTSSKSTRCWRHRTAESIGVEVKAGATVRTEDLAGLRNLANQVGDRFVAGFVLYTGPQTLPFGERIRALPMDALWHLAP